MQRGKGVNMANKEDKVDNSIGNYIPNEFTHEYTRKSRISGSVLISTRVGNFLKMKQARARNKRGGKRGDRRFGLTV